MFFLREENSWSVKDMKSVVSKENVVLCRGSSGASSIRTNTKVFNRLNEESEAKY